MLVVPTYTASDTIIIDVFLDATDVGITIMSFGILSTEGAIAYCGVCSAALPIVHPTSAYGSNGAMPGYILYAPGEGGSGATILYPQQTPNWLNFPLPPGSPPGLERVNINYAEPAFGVTTATGSNIWIASLVYHISGPGTISMCCELYTGMHDGIPPFGMIFDTPIVVNFVVPEPTTAFLIGFGLVGVGAIGTRKF